MTRMVEWIVTSRAGSVEKTVVAATPESAAKKACGSAGYGCHWESFKSATDVPDYGYGVCHASSEYGTFCCAIIEHG